MFRLVVIKMHFPPFHFPGLLITSLFALSVSHFSGLGLEGLFLISFILPSFLSVSFLLTQIVNGEAGLMESPGIKLKADDSEDQDCEHNEKSDLCQRR